MNVYIYIYIRLNKNPYKKNNNYIAYVLFRSEKKNTHTQIIKLKKYGYDFHHFLDRYTKPLELRKEFNYDLEKKMNMCTSHLFDDIK